MSSHNAFATSDRLCANGEPSNCYLVGDFPADLIQAAGDPAGTFGAGPATIRFINGDWYIGDYFVGNFGAAGWTPVIGDWDGDGIDNIGVYNNGTWVLKQSWNFQPASYDIEIHQSFGGPKWLPIVGDWNNDGHDTLGAYKDGTFKIRMISGNSLTDRVIDFGDLGFPDDFDGQSAHPIAGSFDNGPDRVGITHDGYAFYSRTNDAGTRSISYPVSSNIHIGFIPFGVGAGNTRFPLVIDAHDPNAVSTKANLVFSKKPAPGNLQPSGPGLGGLWILTMFKNLEGNPVDGDATYDPYPIVF
ncbi:MAG: hypothetical protein AB8G18_01220 [Gammaproteobacteria bacterium]